MQHNGLIEPLSSAQTNEILAAGGPPELLRTLLFPLIGKDNAARLDCASLGIRIQAFAPQSVVEKVGEESERLWIGVAGWFVRYNDLADGERSISQYFSGGDILNVSQLGHAWARSELSALTDASALSVPIASFKTAIYADPSTATAFGSWMARQIAEIERQSRIMVQGTAAQKLAYLLLSLSDRQSSLGSQEGLIAGNLTAPVTQKQFGEAAGITPITVNRIFKSWKDLGLIKLTSGRLIVQDRSELTRMISNLID